MILHTNNTFCSFAGAKVAFFSIMTITNLIFFHNFAANFSFDTENEGKKSQPDTHFTLPIK